MLCRNPWAEIYSEKKINFGNGKNSQMIVTYSQLRTATHIQDCCGQEIYSNYQK